ncbi:hypothetical protein K490DRAFT_31211 [Saccharata proteae CBS 121410]|uniref:Rhodopsin domain-containing protein n=1 Tax=Saccharata proteae CBS 121410 TaxID=1314787 RepID=A0A9P4I2Q1_9PEZI|nr:hypothetical protein K490DRAFT_31211 [Saccharata proteae CBS 121410]
MTYVNVASVIAVSVILPLLAIAAVVLRILQRRSVKSTSQIILSGHLDDVFCALALIPTVATGIIMIIGASQGALGTHTSADQINDWITSTTPTYVLLEKCVYAVFVVQPLALGFIKLSFLFFYRRIICGLVFDVISWFMIAMVTGWTIAFFFGFVFDCQTDFAANWGSLSEIGAVCGFGFLPTIVYTILDASLDFFILFLPIPWILRLQMPTIRKFQVCAAFLLGGFAVAAGLVRMAIYIETNTPSNGLTQVTIMGLPIYDIQGISSAALFWTMVETGVAVIASCLPTLRPVLSVTAFSNVLSSLRSFLSARYSGSRTGTRVYTDEESGHTSEIAISQEYAPKLDTAERLDSYDMQVMPTNDSGKTNQAGVIEVQNEVIVCSKCRSLDLD